MDLINGKITKISIESKTFKVSSSEDYNTKDLNDIVDDVIKELPLMSNLRKELCINYDKSINIFKKEYQKQFHHMFVPNENLLRKNLRKLNKENIQQRLCEYVLSRHSERYVSANWFED